MTKRQRPKITFLRLAIEYSRFTVSFFAALKKKVMELLLDKYDSYYCQFATVLMLQYPNSSSELLWTFFLFYKNVVR